jgi:hypothetical protein
MGSSELALSIGSYLLYFTLPLWIGAGFADWVQHRRTHIERTSGIKESLLHMAQMGEVGLPALMALLFQINALIILLMIIGYILHEATALWDVGYAARYRYVSPFEQHVHSFLEVLPLIAGSLLIILHWDQFLSLWGMGTNPARFTVELKEPPLPWAISVASFSASYSWLRSRFLKSCGAVTASEESASTCLQPDKEVASEPCMNGGNPSCTLLDSVCWCCRLRR